MADPDERAPTARREFLRGLIGNSGSSLIIAGVVCLLGILTLVFMVSEDRVATMDPGYLADSPIDHDAFATQELLRLQRSGDVDRPLVVIIGASVERMSFGSASEIEAAIAERHGTEVDVAVLATGRQSLLEHLGILQLLPSGRPTVAIVGIGPGRFVFDEDDLASIGGSSRIGVDLPAVVEARAAAGHGPGAQTGVFAFDSRRFLLPRWKSLVLHAIVGPVQHNESSQYIGPKMPAEKYRIHSRGVSERLEEYDDHVDENLATLSTIQREFGDRPNLELAFVEHAINPEFVEEYTEPGFYEDHVDRMRDWSADHGATYWTIGLDQELEPDVFYDWAHLRDADAQRRMREDLVSRLGPQLAELEGAE